MMDKYGQPRQDAVLPITFRIRIVLNFSFQIPLSPMMARTIMPIMFRVLLQIHLIKIFFGFLVLMVSISLIKNKRLLTTLQRQLRKYLNSHFQTGLKNVLDRAVLEHGVHHEISIADWRKVDELPFDFSRRLMSVVVDTPEGVHRLICKGAPEELFKRCTRFELDGDVNAVDDNGETAMHGAALKNLPKVVQFLAERGANVEVWNRKNSFGSTPLMFAQGHRPGNFKPSFETIDAIQRVMLAAGVAIPTNATSAVLRNSDWEPVKKRR